MKEEIVNESRRTTVRRRTLRNVVLGTLCGAGLLAFTLPALAQIEIKLGHVGEPGSLFQKSADEFARRANAKLGDKAKVVAYGSSQLGGDSEMIQKLKRSGEIEVDDLRYLERIADKWIAITEKNLQKARR